MTLERLQLYRHRCPLSSDEHHSVDLVNATLIFSPISEALVLLSQCSTSISSKAKPHVEKRRAYLEYVRRDSWLRFGRVLAVMRASRSFQRRLDFGTTYEMEEGEILELVDV